MGNEASATPPRQNGPQLPSNARLMNTAIKQRLSKGTGKTTYNMKVVIRGDRQTGKSALFHRLEGGSFIREHRVTEQIQCSHVLWPYKTSDEMVNLEIWDVVDKAIIPSHIVDDSNGAAPPASMSKNLLPADASTIDVYKGAHAVIFMVDPTRKWTLDYVTANISDIPDGIDCVVLFCKKDLHHIWTMTDADIETFRSTQSPNVRTLQISLQDCYGMKELHSFFNVPFLKMKKKSLQQELDRAQREYNQSIVELDILLKHQNYEEFLQRLRSLQEQKVRKNRNHTAVVNNVALPTPKVKQTVRSSKDLPLFQEQQQKEEQKKKAIQEQKRQALRQQDNLETFKPSGGLNDDFFADVGDDDDDDDNDEEEHHHRNEDDDEDTHTMTQKQQRQQLASPGDDYKQQSTTIKAKPIAMRMPSSEIEDDESHSIENDDEHIHAFIEKVAMDAEADNHHHDEDNDAMHSDVKVDDPNDATNVDADVQGNNGHSSPVIVPVIEQEDAELVEESAVDNNNNSDNNINNQHMIMQSSESTPLHNHNDDDDKRNGDGGGGGKLQSLMKLHSAEVEESESDEFDAEPLVFAAAPQRIVKLPSKQKQTLTPQPSQDAHSTKLQAIDLGGSNDPSDAMDFIMNMRDKKSPSPKSPISVTSMGDEEQSKEKSKRRKKEKKEKKERKKKKKKKSKHSDDEEEDQAELTAEEKKNRKKNKKKKKKSKEKENEKEKRDLVEFEDSDQNQSDDIVEIE
eukprot:CAMPEP_0202691148 /NCGR_PEP_ID=MMETSP1385-20130828/5941_1 /ASSEMBLY_ACC=CAM_ASM_000861 /TAXON_ID=933848 /ORGANISM="Elphidium margaritaceum" /LENGTH=739 /DNA_ID=CAMNT_0049346507 /DNA_START=110 /DNA_END=2329 /DNA_ORIENTATION=-